MFWHLFLLSLFRRILLTHDTLRTTWSSWHDNQPSDSSSHDKQLFSCRNTQIHFSYRNTVPSSELSLMFVPVFASGKKVAPDKETKIFRQFTKSTKTPETDWIREAYSLPTNQSSRYYLRFEATGGISRDQHPNHEKISLTNITLSKECFGIGKDFHLDYSFALFIFSEEVLWLKKLQEISRKLLSFRLSRFLIWESFFQIWVLVIEFQCNHADYLTRCWWNSSLSLYCNIMSSQMFLRKRLDHGLVTWFPMKTPHLSLYKVCNWRCSHERFLEQKLIPLLYLCISSFTSRILVTFLFVCPSVITLLGCIIVLFAIIVFLAVMLSEYIIFISLWVCSVYCSFVHCTYSVHCTIYRKTLLWGLFWGRDLEGNRMSKFNQRKVIQSLIFCFYDSVLCCFIPFYTVLSSFKPWNFLLPFVMTLVMTEHKTIQNARSQEA